MTSTHSNAVSLVDLRNSLGDIINRVSFAHTRTTVTKNGKNVAAIIPLEDLKLLEEFETQADSAALEEARREDDGSRISLGRFRAGERL